jgi:hypothetical protein
MKTLLLALSLIALPLTANITWDMHKKRYQSTSALWSDKLNAAKYHWLALMLNEVIAHSMVNYGGVFSPELADLKKFLKDDSSAEALVLLADIDEFLMQFHRLDLRGPR